MNISNQCTVHSNRTLDLFCINCKKLICTKCSQDHKGHNFEDYEEYYKSQKYTETIESIKLKINTMKTQSESEEILFNEVKLIHDQQKHEISEYFRELHDTLHIREVELKRELDSYYHDNEETYIKTISNFNYQIETLSNSMNLLDINNNNNNNNNNDIIGNMKGYYEIYEFKKNNISDPIGSLEKKLLNPAKLSVCSLSTGFQYLDLNSLELSKIKLTDDNKFGFNFTFSGNFDLYFQNNNINNNVHFFFATYNIYKLEFREDNKMFVTTLPDNDDVPAEYPSTIYDGKDHIWIIGGLKRNRLMDTIAKFNIHTYEINLLENVKLPEGLRYHQLTKSGENIYISGGNNNKNINKSIYILNTVTETIQTISCNVFGLPLSFNANISCIFIQKDNSYFYCQGNELVKLDSNYKILNRVLLDNRPNPTASKLLYDGTSNSLYIIHIDTNTIFHYNINKNTLEQVNVKIPFSNIQTYITISQN